MRAYLIYREVALMPEKHRKTLKNKQSKIILHSVFISPRERTGLKSLLSTLYIFGLKVSYLYIIAHDGSILGRLGAIGVGLCSD